MSTKQQPVTTTQSQQSAPWDPAQNNLIYALEQSNRLVGSDTGYKPYTGETQAAISAPSQQALDSTLATANGQGGLLGGQAVGVASDVMNNGGISAGQQGALGILGNAANGGMQIGTGGYNDYLNQAGAQTASQQNLGGMAAGGQMSSSQQNLGGLAQNGGGLMSSEQNLQNMANGSDLARPNPYLEAALAAANRQTADQVNGQFSAAGRYGSGAQTNVLSRNIGEQNTNAYMQDYTNAQNRMLSANSQMDAAKQARLNTQMGANSQIDSARNALSGLQLQANGQMDSAAQNRLGGMLSGLNGMAGIQGQNIQNQLSSASGLSDAYAGGMNRQLSTALNGQQFTNQLYDPAQKIAGVGSFYDDRAQTALNSDIAQYDAEQARPWEQLARLNAIATGAGQLGGTQSGTSTKPGQSDLQNYLGLGTSAAGLLGKLI